MMVETMQIHDGGGHSMIGTERRQKRASRGIGGKPLYLKLGKCSPFSQAVGGLRCRSRRFRLTVCSKTFQEAAASFR
jgi:hypothetical protein